MKTKKCGNCKEVKPVSEFNLHKRDGYQSSCKECQLAERRIYYRTPKGQASAKRVYERRKARGYPKEYRQRPEVKKRVAELMRQYTRDPRLRIRFLARWYAKRMTANGTIIQQPCASCGREKTQRHHPDYDKPLLIVWLCEKCHRELHQQIRDSKSVEEK